MLNKKWEAFIFSKTLPTTSLLIPTGREHSDKGAGEPSRHLLNQMIQMDVISKRTH